MALWRLYYHLIWATKNRESLISPTIEPDLYGFIKGKAHHAEAIVHAINGTPDHVHMIVSIPPKLSIAEFVQIIKGSSAHHMNQTTSDTDRKFGWQRGYGIFSLGSKQLPAAINYVDRQKEHHQHSTTIAMLEQVE